MRNWLTRAGVVVAACFISFAAHANGVAPAPTGLIPTNNDAFRELESRYLFGFTFGTDTGAEGEREIELETTAGFQRRGGTFHAVEQEFEFEFVPSQFNHLEFSLHGVDIHAQPVSGIDNVNQTALSGFSVNYLQSIIARGPGAPFGVAVSIQPEYDWVDGTSGTRTHGYSAQTKLLIDTEIIPQRLFAAVNAIYAPEISRAKGDSFWSRTASFGLTGALATRVLPKLTLGAEAEYYRSYDSFGMSRLQGQAAYIGPTFHYQFTHKIFMSAAWSTQFWGHASGETGRHLDLTNFQQQKANIKLGFEF
ncbi:MAG: hypothetical protein KGJ29_13095 [Hyphomicrobiales bacterium]|nr:hypothetical protein [Hyphomicrobiales bacterium]